MFGKSYKYIGSITLGECGKTVIQFLHLLVVRGGGGGFEQRVLFFRVQHYRAFCEGGGDDECDSRRSRSRVERKEGEGEGEGGGGEADMCCI